MSDRTAPPYRGDHVGSLLRPPQLHQARADHAASRITDEELRAIEDDAIKDAVKMQEDVGLKSATDGEFRRASWHMDFIYQLGGVSEAEQHTTATPKLTIPSPSMVHYRGGRATIDETIYPDLDEFWSDLTAAYAEQVKAIAGLGCTYLQFDDTSLAYLCDPQQRAEITSRLSPQCGFSSTVEGNALSSDQQVAKLRLVVETAQEVWG